MLTSKYVVSPIDNKEYCRKNGQFLRHLKVNGFKDYQDFHDQYYPNLIEYCSCGRKCTFETKTMSYKRSCGIRDCVGKVTSSVRELRTPEQWDDWRKKYKRAMDQKSPEEKQKIISDRTAVGHKRGSYKASVKKREQTCAVLYGDKKYNNNTQISQTKLDWDESRKQLFKDRLSVSLGGKTLHDFHTAEMFLARRKMLEERGDIIPESQLTEWQLYNKTVRNLTEQVYRKHKHVINPSGLPRGLSKTGVEGINVYQLDHIVPIFYGFQNQIPETLIASLQNLQLLHWRDNNIKGKKYDPTVSTKHKELEN
jgi:hypothetical protein